MNRLPIIPLLLAGTLVAQTVLPPALSEGRRQLAAQQYAAALGTFNSYAATHPRNALTEEGIGDALVGLDRLEDAEVHYRQATSLEPELWPAHKSLVQLEARLGRWEDFDNERALLRGARQRGAPGITMHESDTIDSFAAGGSRWTVREYSEPAGRSMTRYNFQRFEDGRIAEYISLEPKDAAEAALIRDPSVAIGHSPTSFADVTIWALNWYTGAGHGTIRTYTGGEPRYETVRADMLRWLRKAPARR